jgi:hypothetical protein
MNDFCSSALNFLCDFPRRPLLRLRGLCAGSDLDVLYYPVFFPGTEDNGTVQSCQEQKSDQHYRVLPIYNLKYFD